MEKLPHKISHEDFDAVLFDLDGVLTSTAAQHSHAWKEMFDEFLEQHARRSGIEFRPFDIERDYALYVDGKPRYDGVSSFLRSRGIELEWGSASDGPELETVCGLGNRKNELVTALIEKQGIEMIPGSLEFVKHVRAQGMKTAVVSSSKNCLMVLRAADIEEFFDARVDGVVAATRGLPGKPLPDTFLAAAKELDADVERSVVIEDAISGVQAARAGGFGLVVGIAAGEQATLLRENGANVVVSDLRTLI